MAVNRFILMCLWLMTSVCFAWNAVGHRLIAQIAYDKLTPKAQQLFDNYNRALARVYRQQTLVNAAPWLDSLRYRNKLWLQPLHYIDLPFSSDGTTLKSPGQQNAVSAIQMARAVILNPKETNFEKGFSVRVLIHVIGDLHQPLHAANRFTTKHPQGDQGGNLFRLGKNKIGKNLHSYWDKGGGLLTKNKRISNKQLIKEAHKLEQKWPCPSALNLDPYVWAVESHQLALKQVYSIKEHQTPDPHYQYNAQKLSEKQIAMAGCRLASVLNQLAQQSL